MPPKDQDPDQNKKTNNSCDLARDTINTEGERPQVSAASHERMKKRVLPHPEGNREYWSTMFWASNALHNMRIDPRDTDSRHLNTPLASNSNPPPTSYPNPPNSKPEPPPTSVPVVPQATGANLIPLLSKSTDSINQTNDLQPAPRSAPRMSVEAVIDRFDQPGVPKEGIPGNLCLVAPRPAAPNTAYAGTSNAEPTVPPTATTNAPPGAPSTTAPITYQYEDVYMASPLGAPHTPPRSTYQTTKQTTSKIEPVFMTALPNAPQTASQSASQTAAPENMPPSADHEDELALLTPDHERIEPRRIWDERAERHLTTSSWPRPPLLYGDRKDGMGHKYPHNPERPFIARRGAVALPPHMPLIPKFNSAALDWRPPTIPQQLNCGPPGALAMSMWAPPGKRLPWVPFSGQTIPGPIYPPKRKAPRPGDNDFSPTERPACLGGPTHKRQRTERETSPLAPLASCRLTQQDPPKSPPLGGREDSKVPQGAGLGSRQGPRQGDTRGGGSNTSQPQSGGLFGSTTAQPATSTSGGFSFNQTSQPQQSGGGLFGGGAAASQPQQSGGGLFGGGAATSQPQPSGGLFGRVTPASIQTSGGGLFGGGSTAVTSTQQTGGLFGSTPAASSQPSTGGLFGNAPATSQTSTGGLFGNTPASTSAGGGLFGNNTAATTSTGGGGLFGNSTITQPQASASTLGGGLFGGALGQPKPAGGLFGNTTTASTPAALSTGGGLFGSSTAPKPATSGGLFGSLNQASQSQQQQQQTVPAVRVDASNIKPTTRFSELHEDVQQLILFIDELVQSSIKTSMQCSEAMPQLGQAIEQLPRDVEYLDSKIETVEGALSRDATAVGQSKEVIHADAQDALRVFRAVENLKLPPQFHYSSIGGGFSNTTGSDEEVSTTDLLPYFQQNTSALGSALEKYQGNVLEVEQHLRTVEGSAIESIEKLVRRRQATNGGGNGVVDPRKEGLRELAGAMRGFEEAVLRVAGRVGEAREGVVEVSLGGGLGRGR